MAFCRTVPFTRRWGVSLIFYAVNGTREAAALPLSIPAAPRGNRCFALRSPPACLTAAGSTRHPVSVRLCPPSMASRPCHSRFGSPISAGVNTVAERAQVNAMKVSLWARFCRPDKAQPPSGNGCGKTMPDGADAYPAYAVTAATIKPARSAPRAAPASGGKSPPPTPARQSPGRHRHNRWCSSTSAGSPDCPPAHLHQYRY